MSATGFQLKFLVRDLPTATPFVKWVGGKRKVIPELMKDMPSVIEHYYEPFVGGGALFFHLRSQGLLMDNCITLSDTNLRLVRTYRAVRDTPGDLIDRLRHHAEKHCPEHFYAVRSSDVDRFKSDVDVAAWFIYLNKTAFNGLYRVNKRNQFNAPIGRYKNPRICDEDKLVACSAALQTVEIRHAYFDHMRQEACPGDFVYFDPPYVPVSVTSNFTSYTKNGFGQLEQNMLRDLAWDFKEQGVNVILSNADHPLVRDLYGKFSLRRIEVGRAINCNGKARGSVGEVVIS